VGAAAWAGMNCCGVSDDTSCTRAMAATTQPATQPAAKYACPMGCATADKPGKCPKCGMDLVKQEPAGKEKSL